MRYSALYADEPAGRFAPAGIMELTKGTKLASYELVMRIGRGGMATVWVAREHAGDPAQDRLVAIKAMLADLADEPEFVRMFLDEVRLVRSIRHPNIVDVYDVGEEDGVMWMAMEWVEGESLHSVIAEAGKRRAIPAEIAVRVIADAAAGLHAAHELRDVHGVLQNLVHRDVSPHNILISTAGTVKLVDFGVAKAVGRLSGSTRSGQLKGKFGYMSPEQASGQSVDRRSDVFALGIVLYELTTSRRLFRGDSDLGTLRLVTGGQIPRPSRIDPSYPPALERVVMKALERNVDRRYQSAAELESDLREFLKAERIVVPASGVAGLLKRVMGARIEQRRKAVRKALKALETPDSIRTPELISPEPAFTPTGADPGALQETSSVTNISNVSSLSQVGPWPSGAWPSGGSTSQGQSRRSSRLLKAALLLLVLTIAALVGYLLYQSRFAGGTFDDGPANRGNIDKGKGWSAAPRGSGVPNAVEPEPAAPASPGGASVKAPDTSPPEPKGSHMPTLSLDELEVEQEAQDAEAGQ